MIHLFLSALLWIWNHRSLDQISRNNIARREAEVAYQQGNYARAAERYTYLTHLDTNPEPALLLNLGHSCFRLGENNRAKLQYEKLRQTGSSPLVAIADVQLGVIACQEKDSTRALVLFQEALLQNPDNEPARYNFELIKKTYSNRLPIPPSGRQPKAKTHSGRQQAMANEFERAPAPTLVRSVQKNDKLTRFRNLNMTEEQARHILDAMQGDDLPYSLARQRGKANESEPGNQW